VERFNLSLRQHVAAIGRRTSTLCKGEAGLRQQSDTPRRAGGLMSRAASKAAGCHLPTQTA
jgi:hypothetical protein